MKTLAGSLMILVAIVACSNDDPSGGTGGAQNNAGAGAGGSGGAAGVGGGAGGAGSGGAPGGTGGDSSGGTGAMHAGSDAGPIDNAVDAGIDASDGVMGMDAGVCEGDFDVNTMADVAAIAGCTRITGNLNLIESAVMTLSLPLLERVDASVHLKDNALLTTVSMPALKVVGGSATDPLQGFIDINDNDELISVDVSAVERAVKGVAAMDNRKLPALRFPALTQTVALQVYGHDALAVLEFPALTTVDGALELTANFVLPEITLPVLASVGGDFDVVNNFELTTFGFPLLTTVGGAVFAVWGNTMLMNCHAQRVLDQLVGFSGDSLIDNDREGADVCP